MKVFTIILVMLISINMVSAVGIKWVTEGIEIKEGEERCITYYAYNPSESDISIAIDVTESLQEVVDKLEQEPLIIEAGVGPDKAKEIEFCFQVPRVYDSQCIIGSFLCEQQCEEDTQTYKGEVMLTEGVAVDGATGSGATISARAPLSIQVGCTARERDWNQAVVGGIIIVLIVLAVLFYKKYSTPTIQRDEDKLQRLQSKITKEKKKK